jgi:transcriptional regulator with XRE-family HTH domain
VASTRNKRAGRLLKSWRVDRGLSPEQLAWAIAEAKLGFVSGRQIRRIEQEGIVPTPRVMFALARFYDATPTQVWSRDVVAA